MKWEDLKEGDVLHSSVASYLVLENVSYVTNREITIKFLNLDNGRVIEDIRLGCDVIRTDCFKFEPRRS